MCSLSAICLTVLFIHQIYGSSQVVIHHPNSVTPFLGIVSEYSSKSNDLSLKGNLVYHSNDSEGCTEWQSINNQQTPNSDELMIGIIDRGTCTFLQKTMFAQSSGLDAIFIVSQDEILPQMTADHKELQQFKAQINNDNIILSVIVPQSFKTFIQREDNQHTAISITHHKSQIWDSAMLIMIMISSILVGIGAYYSSDTERAQMYTTSNIKRRRAPIQEINNEMAWSFIFIASIGLLTLYFFVSKVFMILVFIFCISATNGLSAIFSHLIDHFMPNIQNTTYYLARLDLHCSLSDILGFIPASMLCITWYLFRTRHYAWILQNIMCVGLLLILQRSIRLTNLKIASILLSTAFLYDIFWVFLSPLFFSSSVMVAVATYKHGGVSNDTLPVVLKFPRLDDMFHSPMILGLGDIALPGLLVSYLLRYDYQTMVGISIKKGYFMPSLIGYMIGMVLTDINLILMQSGQPALLFLVPCTLGTTLVLSYRRGHLSNLWNGIANPYPTVKLNTFV